MATGRDVLLVEATNSLAKLSLTVAVQMFKVQFHHMPAPVHGGRFAGCIG
jgi:hypothetical protein